MYLACRKAQLLGFVFCGALFLIAVLASATVSTLVFERIPHVEDEIAYYWQGRIFEAGRLAFPAPPAESFWMPFILLYHGLWFGKYPPGYPLALAIGFKFDAAWLVNPVLGAVALVMIYAIGTRLYNQRVGMMAAALALLSPFYLILSGSFMSHIAAMAGYVFFMLFFIQTYRGKPAGSDWRWWLYPVLAGIGLGYCYLTRQLTAIGLVIPWALLALVDAIRGGPKRFARWLLLAVAFAPFFIFLAYFNYSLVGDPWKNLYEIDWAGDRIGFGKGVGTEGEYTLSRGLENLQEAFTLLQQDLFGWRPAFVLVALPFALLRFDRWLVLFATSALSLILIYLLYWTPGIMYGPRYYFECIPCLFLLIAVGLDTIALRWLQFWHLIDRHARSRHLAQAVYWSGFGLVLPVFLLIAGQGSTQTIPQQMAEYKNWYHMSPGPLEQIEREGIHDALVFVDASKGWTDYGKLFIGNDPGLTNSVIFARDSGREANRRVMQMYPRAHIYLYKDGMLQPYRD